VKDRLSGLEDKIDVKEKAEFLVKQFKSYERNVQELGTPQKTKYLNHGH
jgi:hypothetical protein